MKKRLSAWATLLLIGGATRVLAISRPAPGAEPAVQERAAAGGSTLIIITAVGILAVAIAAFWWVKANRRT